ncbi:leucine-rich repeat, cysteine-containing subtype protein [Tanacetum coccineum]
MSLRYQNNFFNSLENKGSFGYLLATCGYILIQFHTLSQEELSKDPLYFVLVRHQNRDVAQQTHGASVVTARVIFSGLGCLMLGVLIYTIVIDLSLSHEIIWDRIGLLAKWLKPFSSLMGCSKLERLVILLRHGGLTDVGLEHIGKHGANLRSLFLPFLGNSNAGLVKLSEGYPRVRKLKLWGCPFNKQVAASYVFNIPTLRSHKVNSLIFVRSVLQADFFLCNLL